MKSPVERALLEHPFGHHPSARLLLKRKMISVGKYPSEAKVQDLAEIGIEVDYQNSDNGEEMIKHNFD